MPVPSVRRQTQVCVRTGKHAGRASRCRRGCAPTQRARRSQPLARPASADVRNRAGELMKCTQIGHALDVRCAKTLPAHPGLQVIASPKEKQSRRARIARHKCCARVGNAMSIGGTDGGPRQEGTVKDQEGTTARSTWLRVRLPDKLPATQLTGGDEARLPQPALWRCLADHGSTTPDPS